jgi:hypothetical protein
METNELQSDLTNYIAAVISECRDDGMVMPFIVCAVSPNGSVAVSRVGSGDVEPLAEHYESRGFSVPMTIMVVDQENTAAKATVTPWAHSGRSG